MTRLAFVSFTLVTLTALGGLALAAIQRLENRPSLSTRLSDPSGDPGITRRAAQRSLAPLPATPAPISAPSVVAPFDEGPIMPPAAPEARITPAPSAASPAPLRAAAPVAPQRDPALHRPLAPPVRATRSPRTALTPDTPGLRDTIDGPLWMNGVYR